MVKEEVEEYQQPMQSEEQPTDWENKRGKLVDTSFCLQQPRAVQGLCSDQFRCFMTER